jgi:hypothetical protein
MKKMGVQLVHSIYGETEQAQLAEVADTSGSAAASQLHVLVIIKLGLPETILLLAMAMGNMGY